MEKKTLSQDLDSSLEYVSRGYIRKPVTIIFSLILFIIYTPVGIFKEWWSVLTDFTMPCWRGQNKKH